MDEKKFVAFKKEELGVKEYIKNALGKGKISGVVMEYTPVGEKIVIATSRPGLVIGRRGEKIEELTRVLKTKFKLDNPHIEIKEITQPALDAQLMADNIALLIEREGSLKFKVIAYRALQDIMRENALGAELVLSGKLPGERARTWRFKQGLLKKTGEPSKVVLKGEAQAITIAGVVGIEVSILPPDAKIHDRIVMSPELFSKIKVSVETLEREEKEEKERIEAEKPKKKPRKKTKKAQDAEEKQ